MQSAVLFETVTDTGAQLLEGPIGLGHANDRHVQCSPFDHRLKRGEDFFVGEVASRAEENESVGVGFVHDGWVRLLE